MGNRKAPSPPPGSPGYKGPMQFKPTPPPPPPAKQGVTVTIENSRLLYDAIQDIKQGFEASVRRALQKEMEKLCWPKGTPRKGKGKR